MSSHAHHLELGPEALAGNGGLGRYVLLPGSPGRAQQLAERLTGVTHHPNRRRMDVYTGALAHEGQAIDVAVVPSGMGCPSVDIIVNELLALGARRILRVGTTGTLSPSVKLGDLVIATGAVRDEAASDAYAPRELPAVADPLMVEALSHAALGLGLGDRVHLGVVHTKDSFYGREFAQGPDAARNRAYMDHLGRCHVLASEMEAAHLFVLGAVFGGGPTSVAALRTHAARVRCGVALAVIGSVEEGIAPLEVERAAEARLADLALTALGRLAALEGRPG